MADQNTIIKDGVGNAFTLRSKDLSTGVRRSMVYATPYPPDYDGGGSFHMACKSGTMAAGLSAGSTVLAFRFTSSTIVAIIKRVRLSAWSAGTGFTAGVGTFDMVVARNFTAHDTGGATVSMTGDTGKMRTNTMEGSTSAIIVSTTAALTAGSRILDSTPMDTVSVGVGTTTYTTFMDRQTLFEKMHGSDHPLILESLEGFELQATVPATGIWGFVATIEWDEVPYY